MNKDTLVVTLGDMHSGSNYALFPDRFVEFTQSKGNHHPNSEQLNIWKHFEKCAKEIVNARRDKKLIIVHNGDAIEGSRYGVAHVCTVLEKEQIDIHTELMVYFKKAVDYRRGDELYYTTGTEVHTNMGEDVIGKELGAVQADNNLYAFDELKLTINGKRIFWTHHGAGSGDGPNKGNAFRNWLRNRFYEAKDEGRELPNMIITSHTHDPYWQIYIGRYEGNYFSVRGLISPSWQQKTRYAHKRAPFKLNKIGLQYFTIYKDGAISDPVELIMI